MGHHISRTNISTKNRVSIGQNQSIGHLFQTLRQKRKREREAIRSLFTQPGLHLSDIAWRTEEGELCVSTISLRKLADRQSLFLGQLFNSLPARLARVGLGVVGGREASSSVTTTTNNDKSPLPSSSSGGFAVSPISAGFFGNRLAANDELSVGVRDIHPGSWVLLLDQKGRSSSDDDDDFLRYSFVRIRQTSDEIAPEQQQKDPSPSPSPSLISSR
ncbi:hypothetical protein N7536_000179 [Penicillium majusculum]|nr:hypothetical protein N7536_000179 [Penicillium majusculum]